MGHKDISIVHAEAIGVQEAVCIFEGFMDFLSFKTLEKQGDGRAVVDEPCDYIVLNSVANMQRCLQRLGVYEHIYCFWTMTRQEWMAIELSGMLILPRR